MSRCYYNLYIKSRNSSSAEDIKTIFGVFIRLLGIYWMNDHPSELTVTITQEYGFELVEKRQMRRLIKKYKG